MSARPTRRTIAWPWRPWLGAVFCALIVACGGGDGSSVMDPPDDDPPDPPPGDVQTATLTVRGVIDGEDSEVAEELGFASALPGALVRIQRFGSSTTMTATADADGVAIFEELLEGNYSISVARTLDAQEVAGLSTDNRDVTAFGGARIVQVLPPGRDITVTAAAGRRGSLVISEHYFSQIFIPGSTGYWFSGFMELYNNSDTTIFLDGKHVGSAWNRLVDEGQWPCSSLDDMRFDPEGLWTRLVYRIPGSGGTHPLQPGQTAVLAIDGIDHGPLIQGGLDLTGADFEFLGSGDVDNPGIPNLESVGPAIDSPLGHGLIFGGISAVPFVADPIDIESLPRRVKTFNSDFEYVRIPAEAVLDVGHFLLLEGNNSPHCVATVDPTFDRGAANIPRDALASLSRRVLFEMEDGRAVLQRTRTSARDFEPGPRTPGTVR